MEVNSHCGQRLSSQRNTRIPRKENPMIMVWTYASYLAIGVAFTVVVALTLYKNGRVFLVDAFQGNTALADSVNRLLVVGFYLINIGFISVALKYGDPARELQEVIE